MTRLNISYTLSPGASPAPSRRSMSSRATKRSRIGWRFDAVAPGRWLMSGVDYWLAQELVDGLKRDLLA